MKTTYSNLIVLMQIFAAEPVFNPQAQPVNNTSSAELAAEMKIFYDKMLIKEAKPNLIHDQFAVKKPIPKGNGKTIEFRKLAPLPKADTPLVEGVSPEGKNLKATAFAVTVSQFGDFIHYTDMLTMTSIDNLVVEGLELLSAQAGVTLDTVVRNAINSGTNGFMASSYDPTTGAETKCYSRYALTSANKLTVKEIKKAVTRLKKANAPKINGSYVAIIHPCVSEDLQNDPEFIEAHKYAAPENLFEGEIGKMCGVRFMESTEAKIFSGENLAGDERNLIVSSDVSNSTTVNIKGTLVPTSLKGRQVIIGGVWCTITNNSANTIIVDKEISCQADTVIYPGEGGAEGCSVFSCLFIAKGAYATTEIEGGGLRTFIKQLGSAGAADPLDQRSTVGWKAQKVAEILVENYLVRVEVGSSYNDEEAN